MRGAHRAAAAGISAALMALTACAGAPTSTKPDDIWAMQARWQSRNITNYRYDFDQGGFFNACPRPVHVYVSAASVDSAVVVATGERVTPAVVPMCTPTIDGLFAGALSAAANGTLSRIRYDARYGYITEMVIAGPPDAGGYLAASSFEPE